MALNGTPKDAWHYDPIGSSFQAKLYNFYRYVGEQIKVRNADLVVVEQVSMTRNLNTVRVLSGFEAAAILAAKMRKVMVVQAKVSEVRAAALGNGKLDKEGAYAEVRKSYPSLKLSRFDQGGGDETDAVVAALGGPEVAEK